MVVAFYIVAVCAILYLFIRGSVFIYKTVHSRSRILWRNIIPWIAWALVVLFVVSVTCVLAWRKVFEDKEKYVPAVGGMYFEDSPGEITPYERDKTLGNGGATGETGIAQPDGQYELKFSNTSGEDALPPVYVPANTTVTLKPLEDRGDSVFLGWFSDRALTTRITEVTMDSAKTVYAGWAERAKDPMHLPYLLAGSGGYWQPDGGLTRGDMLVMFSLMVGVGKEGGTETESGVIYADGSGGPAYEEILDAMSARGVFFGFPEDMTDAEELVTRAEFIAVCVRVARLRDKDTTYERPAKGIYTPRYDRDMWAAAELGLAAKWGWLDYMGIPGVGELPLDGELTRAETAYIVNRLLYRDCDERYVDAHKFAWNDVPEDHWARYDILESSIAHSYSGFAEKERWIKTYG
jgi:uncharacterized repeat protein (TIGR02543 family)